MRIIILLLVTFIFGCTDSQNTIIQKAERNFIEGNFDSVLRIVSDIKIKNNPMALYLLGEIYYTGSGVEENKEKGMDFFKKASKLNLPLAEMRIIEILLDNKNRSKSKEYYEFIVSIRKVHRKIFDGIFSIDMNKPIRGFAITKYKNLERRINRELIRFLPTKKLVSRVKRVENVTK